MYELLTPEQMALADDQTIKGGVPGIELMENAAAAIHDTVIVNYPDADKVLILCGIGNNGGDGFALARRLAENGKIVCVYIHGDVARISGDAALAFAKLDLSLIRNEIPDFEIYDLIVDAMLGAGLDRDIDGDLGNLIKAVNTSNTPVLSVDLPSGIDGSTGQVRGYAVEAQVTTTFFRLKPGHVLSPGRQACGTVDLKQIGISEVVIGTTAHAGLLNLAEIWLNRYPFPTRKMHKYDRGHTLVLSGPMHATGAIRLAAQAALRSGSGLVTLASPKTALAINASHLTSVMLRQVDGPKEVLAILEDERFNCIALGPGLEPDQSTRSMVLSLLEAGRTTVLDAGALTAFADNPQMLFEAIKSATGRVFLTPHDGEFSRLFSEERQLSSKIDRALKAADHSGATLILKGTETVVATPNGDVSVSNNAPPWLATAGSGDVLTGMVAGLAAQGMPAFEAASAAVWLHGEAANILGGGLISSDLDEGLRLAIRNLISAQMGTHKLLNRRKVL